MGLNGVQFVRYHTSDQQNQMTAKREPDSFITSMITDRIGRHKILCHNYKFKKATVNLAECETTACVLNAFCPLTQA